MEVPRASNEEVKFSSPEEELVYLREQVAQKERALSRRDAPPPSQESVISQTVHEYGKESVETKLEEHLIIENPQFERALERIQSVGHREKMREIYHVLAEKGVLSSLKIAQAMKNPHLEDDFHRVLVEYVRTGAIVPGLEKEGDLKSLLRMTVYEVTLPFSGMQEGEKTLVFKEVIEMMERFYVGMLPLEGGSIVHHGHFTLELVQSNYTNDIVFYIGVEEMMKDLFVKQILGAFPTAKIIENHEYNIFNEFGVAVGSVGEVTNNFVFPININSETEQDPFTLILNAFTKIEREGEGAAIQFIVYPDRDRIVNKIKHAIGQIQQKIPVQRAIDIPLTAGGVVAKSFVDFFHTQVKGNEAKKENELDQKKADESQKTIELLEEKISAPLLRANLRIVVSAGTKERAEAIRLTLESAFNQFVRPHANGIKFEHKEKTELSQLIHDFTFRTYDEDSALVLNTTELATLYHLPFGITQKDAPQLKVVGSASAPPPSDLPKEGTLIGVSNYRGETKEIRLTKADRLRHLYLIGQTGTGKSVFLKNLAVNDIIAGNGVCFIDPHGSDVQDVLASVPKERIEDVIYFDPSYMERPYGLNMLEYDVNKPEQKIFVVNEMLSIFRKLYEAIPESMGPAFEQYFRNATMLVMEDPETGSTLLEIPRVMADANFRNLKLSRCKNPLVVQFWRDIATKTSGESGLANMIPYITNKFDVFLQNDIMRPIIAQEKSSFNFREIMDNKKILLVNLSKGRLGDINANLIGLVLVGKFLMAALSRVDSYGKQLPDFYLYIDEFQNISTNSISAILSEARKYGLSLNVAHQFIAQLDEDIKKAVFGNVGNMVTFRVGAEDAEFLESQFAPIFKASDIMKIENRNAYAKILIHGKPVSPFNIETLPPPKGMPEIVEQLKQLSYLKYGRDRKIVDEAIMKKYLSSSPVAQTQVAPQASQAQKPVPQVAPHSTLSQQSIQNQAPVMQPQIAQAQTPVVPMVPTLEQVSANPSPSKSSSQVFRDAFSKVGVSVVPSPHTESQGIGTPPAPIVQAQTQGVPALQINPILQERNIPSAVPSLPISPEVKSIDMPTTRTQSSASQVPVVDTRTQGTSDPYREII